MSSQNWQQRWDCPKLTYTVEDRKYKAWVFSSGLIQNHNSLPTDPNQPDQNACIQLGSTQYHGWALKCQEVHGLAHLPRLQGQEWPHSPRLLRLLWQSRRNWIVDNQWEMSSPASFEMPPTSGTKAEGLPWYGPHQVGQRQSCVHEILREEVRRQI